MPKEPESMNPFLTCMHTTLKMVQFSELGECWINLTELSLSLYLPSCCVIFGAHWRILKIKFFLTPSICLLFTYMNHIKQCCNHINKAPIFGECQSTRPMTTQ